jgi:putative tricarboxylic transport membrane protein
MPSTAWNAGRARAPERGPRGAFRGALWGLVCCAAGLSAGCDAGPQTRGWECLAPAAAGGGWDLTCRAVAAVLQDLELAPVLVRVTNLPGAGGGVAYARTVAQRSDDPGLFVAASPSTVLRLAQRQYGRLDVDDVRWVGALGAEYGVLAVAADAPWQTLGELMEAWRAQPDAFVVSGGSAVAGQDHMKVLLLARAAGMDPRRIRYVPFNGGGEAMTALLGGFVQVFSGEASEVEGQLRAGRLRLLAVLAPERLGGSLAHVPTALENGFDVTWVTWRGFYVPGDTPPEVHEAWVERIRLVGESEAWNEARERYRLQPFFMVGPEFEAFVTRQVQDLRDLSRSIGLIE